MTNPKLTLGQAIDQILVALTSLEKREQQTVISTVCSFLELETRVPATVGATPQPPGIAQSVHVPAPSAASESINAPTNARHAVDIRTLKDEKKPDSARQMACIVAYYLMELAPLEEQKQAIATSDIERYFKQASYKLPTKLEQLLIDCKRSGYFEAVTRGEYKLTRVGYNLVTHSMPKSSRAL
jgi:hypothetical protein